jgi:hypothetical protein
MSGIWRLNIVVTFHIVATCMKMAFFWYFALRRPEDVDRHPDMPVDMHPKAQK